MRTTYSYRWAAQGAMPLMCLLCLVACEPGEEPSAAQREETPTEPASPPTSTSEPSASTTGKRASTPVGTSAQVEPAPDLVPIAEQADPAGPITVAECLGGEAGARWQRFSSGGSLVESVIALGAAGHREWRYHFSYEAGELVSARHEVSTFRFDPEAEEPGDTLDTVLRRTYRFAGGGKRCQARHATAPHSRIEAALEAAQSQTIRCEDAERVEELGQRAKDPAEGEPAWLTALCEDDPSRRIALPAGP